MCINHRKHAPRRRGFTLVETLVILGIIAVLAAILFPVLANGKSPAQQRNGMHVLARTAQALNMYAADFGDTFVSAGVPAQNFAWSPIVNPDVDAAGNPWDGWGLRLAPYAANYQNFLYPTDPNLITFSGECANSGPMAPTNELTLNWMLGSDGTYGNVDNPLDTYAWSPDGHRLGAPAALSQIVDPTGTVALTPSNLATRFKQSTGCLASTLQASDFSETFAPGAVPAGGADIAFADGHSAFLNDDRLTPEYQGASGPWAVYHLRGRHAWLEPTMPGGSMGFANKDVDGNPLGDL